MPAASPWLDQYAPPQWGFSNSGAAGGLKPATGGQDSGVLQGISEVIVGAANNSSMDTQLHWKISGTIIVGLLIIFGLQAMGFRFVTSANASFGVGR